MVNHVVWILTLGAVLYLALAGAVHASDAVTAPWLGPGLELFYIERNKNANQVHYRVGVTGECSVDPTRPIVVYWRRLERGPHAFGPLKWVEAKFAFGVEVLAVAPQAVTFVVVADPNRRVEARLIRDDSGICRATAWTPIAGGPAAIERVYVMAKDRRMMWPKVMYVDLYGRAADGMRRCDRISDLDEPPRPCPQQGWNDAQRHRQGDHTDDE